MSPEGTLPTTRGAGSLQSLFVPDRSRPHPSVNPPPSAGCVKTDGCFLNAMQKLTQKPNSSPPHPTAHMGPCEQHKGAGAAPDWEWRCHRHRCLPALCPRQSRGDLGLGAAWLDTTDHLLPPEQVEAAAERGAGKAQRCWWVDGWRKGTGSERSHCRDRAVREGLGDAPTKSAGVTSLEGQCPCTATCTWSYLSPPH